MPRARGALAGAGAGDARGGAARAGRDGDAPDADRDRTEARRGLAPAAARTRRWSWAPAIGLVAAAAAVVLWLRVGHRPPPPVGYAALGSVRGSVRVEDRLIAKAVRVPVGVPITVAAGGAMGLVLDSGARVTDGPGRLTLEGGARDVAVRLADGKLRAAVAPRQHGQTFAVVTRTCASRCAARSSRSTRRRPDPAWR